MKSQLNKNGVTLIELCVVIVMTTILVVIIFNTWTNFNTHVVNNKRKSLLHGEIRQVANSLKLRLRRSPGILSWHQSGITYISPIKGDTITYEYYYEELLKNDVPVPLVSQNAYISQFEIMEKEEFNEDHDFTILSLSITIADDFSNEINKEFAVAVKILSDQYDDEDEELTKWNF